MLFAVVLAPQQVLRATATAVILISLVSSPAWAQSQTRTVNIGSNFFDDTVSRTSTSTIKVGDKIKWVWVSGIHSTTSGSCTAPDGPYDSACVPNGLWNSGEGAGLTFERSFDSTGTFPYFCNVHGAMMKGAVIVQTVTAAATTTVVASSGSPSDVGVSVTFTATVTSGGGAPAGNVTFKNGGVDMGAPAALNGQGVATLSTSALAAGTHAITASYAGNASFAASTSAAISQVVNTAPPLTVTFAPATLDFGSVVLLRASAPRTLTLTNGTGAPISTSSLQITGDYAQTNNCGESLAAQTSCAISVTLTPQGTGTRTGEVTLDGANTVALTCTGVEFALSLTRPRRPPRH